MLSIKHTAVNGHGDLTPEMVKEEDYLIIFPDGRLFVGDISHDMLIFNVVREHSEYDDIWYEIKAWIERFEGSDASCWGYNGIILGHDFAMRHNIVKIYGVDTFRSQYLLCSETANNLTPAQIKTLYQIKELFGNMDQRRIEREFKCLE